MVFYCIVLRQDCIHRFVLHTFEIIIVIIIIIIIIIIIMAVWLVGLDATCSKNITSSRRQGVASFIINRSVILTYLNLKYEV